MLYFHTLKVFRCFHVHFSFPVLELLSTTSLYLFSNFSTCSLLERMSQIFLLLPDFWGSFSTMHHGFYNYYTFLPCQVFHLIILSSFCCPIVDLKHSSKFINTTNVDSDILITINIMCLACNYNKTMGIISISQVH